MRPSVETSAAGGVVGVGARVGVGGAGGVGVLVALGLQAVNSATAKR